MFLNVLQVNYLLWYLSLTWILNKPYCTLLLFVSDQLLKRVLESIPFSPTSCPYLLSSVPPSTQYSVQKTQFLSAQTVVTVS